MPRKDLARGKLALNDGGDEIVLLAPGLLLNGMDQIHLVFEARERVLQFIGLEIEQQVLPPL